MTSNITRIPLAIAMTSVLAFAVGCSNDRTADDRAGMQPNDPAVTAPPLGVPWPSILPLYNIFGKSPVGWESMP